MLLTSAENLSPASLTPVANLPPVVNLQLVVLTPVVHLELRISKVVNFKKIRNAVDGIIGGPGDDDL
jgi:hypothetical protein